MTTIEGKEAPSPSGFVPMMVKTPPHRNSIPEQTSIHSKGSEAPAVEHDRSGGRKASGKQQVCREVPNPITEGELSKFWRFDNVR
jgi:hypothetical protein